MKTFIDIDEAIEKKLTERHNVTRRDVEQCFENKTGRSLLDTREKHATNPPTQWFLAQTNRRRTLKVVYILLKGRVKIKSCFEPNEDEKRIYQQYGE